MGMFDEIVCDYPLPGTPPGFIEPGHLFQTKDLDCTMDVYRIEADGTTSLPPGTGHLRFYTDNIAGAGPGVYTTAGEDAESVEYDATFRDGRIVTLTEVFRERKPALPISRMRIMQVPTETEVHRRQERLSESLLGRRIYVLWGGQTEGYWANVVAEDERHLCVKSEEHGLEIVNRSCRDSIYFDSDDDAKQSRKSSQDEWEERRREYDDLVAARGKLQGSGDNR